MLREEEGVVTQEERNKELLPSVDTGRQHEMHLSEILSPGFFPQGLVFLCVCACVWVQTQTHKHMWSSSTRVLFLRGVMLYHEFHSTRFGDAAEMVLDLPCYRFRVTCSVYMRSQVLSLSLLPSYFLPSGAREFSHVTSTLPFP